MSAPAAEVILGECLGGTFAFACLAVAREAAKRHWLKGGFSITLAITKPDERQPKVAAQSPGATTTTVPPVVAPVPTKTGQDAA